MSLSLSKTVRGKTQGFSFVSVSRADAITQVREKLDCYH